MKRALLVLAMLGCGRPESSSDVCPGTANAQAPRPAATEICTPAREGGFICPGNNKMGNGYKCSKGCWAFFFDGPCHP